MASTLSKHLGRAGIAPKPRACQFHGIIKQKKKECNEQMKASKERIIPSHGGYRSPSAGSVVCCSLGRALRNPSHSPRRTFGFGTGHSRLTCASFCASSSIWRNVDTSSSAAPEGVGGSGRGASDSESISFRRRRRIRGACCPSAVIVISESARVRRGAGHGKRCGRPTTSSEARRVPAKRPVVDRDRG